MGNSVAPPFNTSEEMKKFVVKDDEGMKAKALEDGSYRDGNLYITRKGIDSLWNKYDRDGDGYLHDTEIKQFLLDLIHAIHNRNMEELENQKRIRKSRAGTIDSALRKRYQTRYEEIMMHTELFKSRISDLMHDLDKDSDGLVSEQQFVDYMMNFNILAWVSVRRSNSMLNTAILIFGECLIYSFRRINLLEVKMSNWILIPHSFLPHLHHQVKALIWFLLPSPLM